VTTDGAGAQRRVLCVFGTRPEAIKMAPVVAALKARPESFVTRICVTGQHREMLDQMLALFDLTPDLDLDVMEPDQTLTTITVKILTALERVLAAEQPDWVVVQGDTTTTYAAALAAFYAGIRVAHVEAGLRSGSLSEPMPEEMNRRATDAISDLLFAPTEHAASNLRAEGLPADRITVTGNTVVDAFRTIAARPFDVAASPLAHLAEDPRHCVLVTIHRRENHGTAIGEICGAIGDLARNCRSDAHFVVPVHPNPNVREPVGRLLGGLSNVTLTEPLDYPALVWLMHRCHFVITDSGGIQEEAVGIGKPVLVLRDRTERTEGLETGLAHLVGSDRALLAWRAARVIYDRHAISPSLTRSPYGNGYAAERIAAVLAQAATTHDRLLGRELMSQLARHSLHARF
jgi:UDP-N-acetylglucosamine 2-epimerase